MSALFQRHNCGGQANLFREDTICFRLLYSFGASIYQVNGAINTFSAPEK